MISKIQKHVSKHLWGVVGTVIILIVSIVLSYKNYIPGTWLIGWDNLHSEFNLSLNLKRAIFAVWQEYQGLGLLGGMSHAADLPRVLILYLLSLFFSPQLLRYGWTFAMLTIGPIGAYFAIRQTLKSKSEFVKSLASLTGGLFYLLNLATVQYFYTPYESFTSFYGLMPWCIFAVLRYLNTGKKKNLLLAFVIIWLASPAFYVQTLFVVFAIFVGVFFAESVFIKKITGIKRSIYLGLVIFAASAYWLLPSMYFTLTSSDIVTKAKINVLSTEETRLFNESAGKLENVALLKGFWFNYSDVGEDNQYKYLMEDWRSYQEGNPYVENIGYLLFALSILGISLSFFVKNIRWNFSIAALFFISMVMLTTVNTPAGKLIDEIDKQLPLFSQSFRSVFTKWSVATALIWSFGLAYFVFSIGSILKKKLLRSLLLVLVVPMVVGMYFTTKPAFEGKLIMNTARLEVPQEYFELFDYFDNQSKEARIAHFPVHTFWGWNFYDWGYRGSGFLWYGIKQPILDRAFDVWSPYDEDFYHEVSTAFYARDTNLLSSVLDKYDVTYVLVDAHIIVPQVDKKILKYPQQHEILSSIGEEVWQKGNLTVYKLENNPSFVKSFDEYVASSESEHKTRIDKIYAQNGDYILGDGFGYPFTYLLKEKVEELTYQDRDFGTWINIPYKKEQTDVKLTIPPLKKNSKIIMPAEISLRGKELFVLFQPFLKIENQDYKSLPDIKVTTRSEVSNAFVSINKNIFEISDGETKNVSLTLEPYTNLDIYVFSKDEFDNHDISEEFFTLPINKCWEREGAQGVLEDQKSTDFIYYYTKDAAGCFAFKIDNFETDSLLSVSLPYRSEGGSKPHFCILAEGGEYRCENDEIFYNTPFSPEWTSVNRNVFLEGNNAYWIEITARPPDPRGEGWGISYKPPRLVSYPVNSHVSFSDSLWNSLSSESQYDLKKDGKIAIFSKEEKIALSNFGLPYSRQCDVFERGTFDKNVDNQSVIYKASSYGAVCDVVPLRNYSTRQEYLLRFVGENLKGRSLKVIVNNKTNSKNDVEYLLDKGEFDQTFTLIDWGNLEEADYVLNTEVRSFGGETENVVKKSAIYQVPLGWLSEFVSFNDSGDLGKTTTNLEILDNKKMGTHRYQVESRGGGLVVLSQGYDNGWVAYEVGDSTYSAWVPFLSRKLEHVKVNGWANGWIVNGEPEFGVKSSGVGEDKNTDLNRLQQISTDSNQTIVIIFWPQYLEYLGFVFLLLTLIYLIITFLKREKKESQWQGILTNDALGTKSQENEDETTVDK